MTSIYDIPYEDIKIFLLANNPLYNFNDKDEVYNVASTLLKNKRAKGHTTSIIEWMMAHNLLINKVNIPNYSTYEINKMSKIEINQLAKLLTMRSDNRENIKNILQYLHKLDEENVTLLPDINDIILRKLENLEINEINSGNLKLDDVINLLKTHRNKSLIRKSLYDNMEKIIFHNILNINYDKLDNLKYIGSYLIKLPKYKILEFVKNNEKRLLKNHNIKEINDFLDFLDNEVLDPPGVNLDENIATLTNFLINLVKINEVGLAKQVFDISNKYKFTGQIGIDDYSFIKYLVKLLVYHPENDVNTFGILLGFIREVDFIIDLGEIFRATLYLKPNYVKELINKLLILEKYNLLVTVVNLLAINNYEGSDDVFRLLIPLIKKAIELKDYGLLEKYLKIVDLSIDKKLIKSRTRLLNIDDLMILNKIS